MLRFVAVTDELKNALQQSFEAEEAGNQAEWLATCCQEAAEGAGYTVIALADGKPVGFATLLYEASYPDFGPEGIPEIHGMSVLPSMMRQGIGRHLLHHLEEHAQEKVYFKIGLGVGVTQDYQAALALYLKSGYLPDGRGLYHAALPGNYAAYGDTVKIDSSTTLWFIKEI